MRSTRECLAGPDPPARRRPRVAQLVGTGGRCGGHAPGQRRAGCGPEGCGPRCGGTCLSAAGLRCRLGVVMSVRTTQRRDANGSVRFDTVAHNRRDGDRVEAVTLISLGREDRLDVAGLRQLVGSIARCLGDGPGSQRAEWAGRRARRHRLPSGGGELVAGRAVAPPGHRPHPAGLAGRALVHHRCGGRALFAVIADHAIVPSWNLAAAEWASHDVLVPGVGARDDDQASRAMDLPVGADTQGALQQGVFFAAADFPQIVRERPRCLPARLPRGLDNGASAQVVTQHACPHQHQRETDDPPADPSK